MIQPVPFLERFHPVISHFIFPCAHIDFRIIKKRIKTVSAISISCLRISRLSMMTYPGMSIPLTLRIVAGSSTSVYCMLILCILLISPPAIFIRQISLCTFSRMASLSSGSSPSISIKMEAERSMCGSSIVGGLSQSAPF